MTSLKPLPGTASAHVRASFLPEFTGRFPGRGILIRRLTVFKRLAVTRSVVIVE